MILDRNRRAQSSLVGPDAQDKRQSGFALLLVIWIVALLAVLAAQIAADVQSEVKIARSRLELARARSIAEAGITLAVSALIAPDVTARWRADGNTRTLQYGGGTVAITIQDEAGKIDLNAAPIELIAGLLDELGVSDKDDRDAVLSEIMDRRQAASANAQAPPDVIVSLRGGLPPPGPNSQAAFATNSELRQLGAMTHSLYDNIAPYVTVYSKKPTVNPLTAPREVLAALPGVSEQAIDLYLPAREALAPGQPFTVLPALGSTALNYLSNTEVSAVTIVAKAKTDTGVTFDREAVVSVDQTMNPHFLEWHSSVGPGGDDGGEHTSP